MGVRMTKDIKAELKKYKHLYKYKLSEWENCLLNLRTYSQLLLSGIDLIHSEPEERVKELKSYKKELVKMIQSIDDKIKQQQELIK